MKIPCRPLVYWGTVFLFLAGAVAALKPGAVWITDNGNKYMMMRNIAAGNGLQISHPVPALFPTGGFHFIKEKGTVHSFYPEFLSAFTVPFYKLFGERGILFFPLCATLLLLFLAAAVVFCLGVGCYGDYDYGDLMRRKHEMTAGDKS